MNSKYIATLAGAALLLLASSCSTPKDITYMQGFNEGMTQEIRNQGRLSVQPDDKLSIIVSSKDPALAEVFNLAIARVQVGQETGSSSQGTSAFTVTPNGCINYPLLGEVYVQGLRREEVSSLIAEKLISENLLKDPIVTVEFLNAKISILGDVANPGDYPIDRDNLNLIQAISKAGDLNITGMRENVLVVREEDGKDVAYRVDLTNTRSLFESPVYYLRQNDVIYVEPNDKKKREATTNGSTLLTPSFWMSVVSLLTTITVLIAK